MYSTYSDESEKSRRACYDFLPHNIQCVQWVGRMDSASDLCPSKKLFPNTTHNQYGPVQTKGIVGYDIRARARCCSVRACWKGLAACLPLYMGLIFMYCTYMTFLVLGSSSIIRPFLPFPSYALLWSWGCNAYCVKNTFLCTFGQLLNMTYFLTSHCYKYHRFASPVKWK